MSTDKFIKSEHHGTRAYSIRCLYCEGFHNILQENMTRKICSKFGGVYIWKFFN